MSTAVKEEQFSVSDQGVIHNPTGYKLEPWAENNPNVSAHMGKLGNVLSSGEDYRPDLVEKMAMEIWTTYWEAK